MWQVHNATVQDRSGVDAGRELVRILEEVLGVNDGLAPLQYRRFSPFMISREVVPVAGLANLNGGTEQYRFQYGPRMWSRSIYSPEIMTKSWSSGHDVVRAEYHRHAELFAAKLKAAKWEDPARRLLEECYGLPATADRGVRVMVSFQNDGRLCAILDVKSNHGLAFKWSDGKLSLLGEPEKIRLRHLERYSNLSFETPIVSQIAGDLPPKPSSKSGKIDEYKMRLLWRYSSVLDRKLASLLLEACDQLDAIEGDIGIAFAGHRFNDAAGDDSWLAVRVRNFAWENGQFFQVGAASLRSAPRDVHLALGVLVHLRAAGVDTAFAECYGYPVEPLDVIGLFREGGEWTFACCNSHSFCGPAYGFDHHCGDLSLLGFANRFDHSFNAGRRQGGALPMRAILAITTLEETIRRVESGEVTPLEPPHEVDVTWEEYLPAKS